MNHSAFTWIHWSENERARSSAHLLCRVFRHCAQLRFSSRAIIVCVTNYSLALGQRPSERLIQNLLERIEQLAALIQKDAAIGALDRNQATEIRVEDCRPKVEARPQQNRLNQFLNL